MTYNDFFGLSQHILDQLKNIFEQNSHIKSVILFGSRALGTYRTNSDIDLCMIGPQLTLTDLYKIENQIDDLLLPWKVDIVLYHMIDNPKLSQHVHDYGKEVYTH